MLFTAFEKFVTEYFHTNPTLTSINMADVNCQNLILVKNDFFVIHNYGLARLFFIQTTPECCIIFCSSIFIHSPCIDAYRLSISEKI